MPRSPGIIITDADDVVELLCHDRDLEQHYLLLLLVMHLAWLINFT